MSIDMYGEAVADASALIREFAKQDYFHYFAEGNVEGKLETFIAMMDSCREEGRVKGRGEALDELHLQWLAEKERADKAEARIAELEAQVAELRGKLPPNGQDWFADAEDFGPALNSAGWEFLEAAPKGAVTPLMFNHVKPTLRAAILKYAEQVRAAAPSTVEG